MKCMCCGEDRSILLDVLDGSACPECVRVYGLVRVIKIQRDFEINKEIK